MKRLFGATLSIVGLLLMLAVPATVGAQSDVDDPSEVEAGQAIFETNCSGCHAVDGTGVAGAGRPLIGVAAQADRAQHIESITNGRGVMPAFGERLSEEEVSAVASYVRLTFVDDAAELAVTGVESKLLFGVGVILVAVGIQLVALDRRRLAVDPPSV